jgi:hypothetical protein
MGRSVFELAEWVRREMLEVRPRHTIVACVEPCCRELFESIHARPVLLTRDSGGEYYIVRKREELRRKLRLSKPLFRLLKFLCYEPSGGGCGAVFITVAVGDWREYAEAVNALAAATIMNGPVGEGEWAGLSG